MSGFSLRIPLLRRRTTDLRDAIDRFLSDVPPKAPIRGILASDTVERRLALFDTADRRALGKQKRYRRAGEIARVAGFLGLIVVPLEVTPIQKFLPNSSPFVISILHFAILILTFLAAVLLGLRRSATQWKQARGVAEKARARVFTAIVRVGAKANALPQALSCLQAAHLDWQMRFFDKRIRELPARIQKETRRNAPFRIVGLTLSVVAGFFGTAAVLKFAVDNGAPLPFLSTLQYWLSLPDATLWQHGIKATAWSLLAFAGARFLTHEDVSNAALYPWAKRTLERLSQNQLPGAEKAAADGNLDAVQDFRAQVQEVLDTEHGVWIDVVVPSKPKPPPSNT